MQIILAPMEGLADFWLRQLITDMGGIDLVINEFVRVVDAPLPDRVFYKNSPELLNKGKTRNNTPVRVQLLGSDCSAMAANAEMALSLGSHGIDLNFGCPSKTVNKSCGGAIMLNDPESIYQVVKSVKDRAGTEHIVSAKMRLGFNDTSLAIENAQAIESAGANALTVHGRTKKQGYTRPIYWDWIKTVKDNIDIPVVANGEIWTPQDYIKCQQESDCKDVMIGRGLVSQPDLGNQIKNNSAPKAWAELKPHFIEFNDLVTANMREGYVSGRIKQWLRHLCSAYPEAQQLFDKIKLEKDIHKIRPLIIES
jgi:tRNA-dihydrouridine synthase C